MQADGEFQVSPEEYAKAVSEYSRLRVGQNYIPLGKFLTNKTKVVVPQGFTHGREEFVALLPLCVSEDTAQASASPSPSLPGLSTPDADHESADERRRMASRCVWFKDPQAFFLDEPSQTQLQSRMVFLRGYMSADWINNIGGRFVIDPEFFCRHLDFRSVDDEPNNFSAPPLPSSSWHLIDLPIFTLGARMVPKGPSWLTKVEERRRMGKEALSDHHHRIAQLSSSGMAVGESMIRGYYIFDEAHFAIEQRISICMQAESSEHPFTCKSSALFLPSNYLVDYLDGPAILIPSRSAHLARFGQRSQLPALSPVERVSP